MIKKNLIFKGLFTYDRLNSYWRRRLELDFLRYLGFHP